MPTPDGAGLPRDRAGAARAVYRRRHMRRATEGIFPVANIQDIIASE